MKLKYTFFDKEDFEGRLITYEYDVPFHKNMDEDFKSMYGESLSFVKELNHRDKIIRIHTAYDSGKGTIYVPPVIKPRRQNINLRVADILKQKSTNILKIENEYEDEHLFICFSLRFISIFKNGTFDNGNVSGYRHTIDNTPNALLRYLKSKKYYPYTFKYL